MSETSPDQSVPTPIVTAAPVATTKTAPVESTGSKAKKMLFLILGGVFAMWAILVGIGISMVGEGGKGSGLAGLLGLLSSTPKVAINQFSMFVTIFFAALGLVVLMFFITYLILNSRTVQTDPLKSGRKVKTIVSGIGLALIVFGWVVSFVFLTGRADTFSNVAIRPAIVTDPANTLGLSAPTTVTFDATGFGSLINVQKYKIISYLWDFGDNSTGTGVTVSHEYIDKGRNNGNFTVSLEVTLQDAAGNQTVNKDNKITISIKNVKPNVVFSATPEKGSTPLQVSFDASDSKDIDGQITKYEWDLNGDGKFDDSTSKTASYTYTTNGKYEVGLQLTDNSGDTNIAKRTIDVSDTFAVKALFDATSEANGKFLVGKSYIFDAAKSNSPNGKITQYSWDFGDNTGTQKGRNISHAFQANGTYEVTLTVTDEAGATASKSRKITVGDVSKTPVSNIITTPDLVKGKVSGTAPFTVKFDASKTIDLNNDIVEYAWDFDGDGNPDKFGESVTNIFPDKGTFIVGLTVTDSQDNQVKSQVTVEVTAPGMQAKINATPITGVVPLTVKFDASASTYLDGQIISYNWDFGDGTPKRQDAAKISYKYQKVGTYVATVTIIGSDGKKATDKQTITVQNIPVKACFTENKKEAVAPADIVFNANCSTGTIAKYNWDTNGDGLFTDDAGPQITKTFTAEGTYTISLEVTDTQGVVDTISDTIVITP
ncbi:MAG: PKD domain-containing protein [Candidatus Peregrinibacteria bacterium]|nr:PKD domain-containing protein [Candidatus Peregrinibacteria bacterium]